MKKKKLLPVLALTALMVVSCGKERHCECTVEDVVTNYNPLLIVDHSMNCGDITEMALEEKYVTADGVHSLRRTEVHKVSCREQRSHAQGDNEQGN